MNIVLIGPSGAGKGTHLAKLTEKFGFNHISSGDVFRENLEHGSALGILARRYMSQGELVPDEVVEAMIEEKLQKADWKKGLLFDGFPRTVYQAKFLDSFLGRLNQKLNGIVYLNVSDEHIIKRLAGRMICGKCLTPFHKLTAPFKNCPLKKCEGEFLFQRDDDAGGTVAIRLRVFHRVTDPLLDYYQRTDRLVIVNGEGERKAVEERLGQTVETIRTRQTRFATAQEVAHLRKPVTFVPQFARRQSVRSSLDLLLIGAPGSGKGTQSEQLCREFNLSHISTGGLFREQLDKQTELGKLAKAYMDRGELVPDEFTDSMVAERLSRSATAEGFILDGYPRSMAQAEALHETLHGLGRELSGVLWLKVSDETVLKRLPGRLLCRECQKPYHTVFSPPAKAGQCDRCGGELYPPDDDQMETVRSRLATFHAQTEPLIGYYKGVGLLIEIDGAGSPQEVTTRTTAAVRRLADPSPFGQFRPYGT
jgi:adenylate kinase